MKDNPKQEQITNLTHEASKNVITVKRERSHVTSISSKNYRHWKSLMKMKASSFFISTKEKVHICKHQIRSCGHLQYNTVNANTKTLKPNPNLTKCFLLGNYKKSLAREHKHNCIRNKKDEKNDNLFVVHKTHVNIGKSVADKRTADKIPVPGFLTS